MNELTGWHVVNATTIQRGDQVDMGGWRRRVVDMVTLHGNRKRLVFDDGGSYCLDRGQTLYAYRDTR